MTKAELVNEIAIQTGYDKTTIMNVVEAAMNNIKKTVANGEAVYLRGFGSFGTKTRAAKVARNITKNESILVPEHKIPSFKPADSFAELLKKSINTLQLCQTVRNTKDIRCLPTNVKNVCARIVISISKL